MVQIGGHQPPAPGPDPAPANKQSGARVKKEFVYLKGGMLFLHEY